MTIFNKINEFYIIKTLVFLYKFLIFSKVFLIVTYDQLIRSRNYELLFRFILNLCFSSKNVLILFNKENFGMMNIQL